MVVHLGTHLYAVQPWVLAVSLVTLVTGILARRFLPRLPYMIFAMVAGSLAAVLIGRTHPPEETGIRTVGALSASLPPLSLPDLSPQAVEQTVFPAMVIALLALTEAIAIARSVAARSGQRIDSNQEFVGQGLSNIAGSFFSSYVASGSFNRSGVNYSSGARTPLAAALSAVFLLLILLLVAPLAALLPVPAMAAILFIVAWTLIDLHEIRWILTRHPRERVIFLITFVGTLIDLEKGIFLGVLVSLMFYLYRTSRPSIRELVPSPSEIDNPRRKWHPAEPDAEGCPQLTMLRVEGSIFFGAVDFVGERLRQVDERDPAKKHVVITARPIAFVDRSGAELLAHEAERRRALGGDLYLVGVQPDMAVMLRRSGRDELIGLDHIFGHKGDAIRAIYPTLDSAVCRTCPVQLFRECRAALPDGTPR